jgi:UDP-N-acetylmuramoylalanine--D-glutamate ligase
MIQGKRLLILGGGESGVGAALLGKQQGWEVFLSEKGSISDTYLQILKENEIQHEVGSHNLLRLMTADIVVKSPGIPDSAPVVKQLHESGKTIISEIEFASWYTQSFIIGITGTNGKTTTTRLIYHLLKTGGLDVGLGGNIGLSFAAMVAKSPKPFYVLELSSFQLDGVLKFKPDISLLLNITPDHLDRYHYKMDLYAKAKFKIAENQSENDVFIINEDDKETAERYSNYFLSPKLVKISQSMLSGNRLNVAGYLFDLHNTVLLGKHNAMNAAFAIQTALLAGVNVDSIQQGLESFKNDPHRLEKIKTVKDVLFINDSKGTNVNAVYYALEAMEKPVIWLAGGLDKGNDYNEILPLLKSRVKALVAIGADNKPLKKVFKNMIPFYEIPDMIDAVKQAYALAQPDGIVLLSPACASFDLYKNYEDRGNQFRDAVNNLNTAS